MRRFDLPRPCSYSLDRADADAYGGGAGQYRWRGDPRRRAGAIIGGAATGRAGGAVAGGIIGAAPALCLARSSSRVAAAIIGTTTAAGFVTATAVITACSRRYC